MPSACLGHFLGTSETFPKALGTFSPNILGHWLKISGHSDGPLGQVCQSADIAVHGIVV